MNNILQKVNKKGIVIVSPNILDYNQLKDIFPHAYPFLMIDRVIDFIEGERLIAIKNITANEWPFSSFSEKTKDFPETLLIEAAAQAALVLYHVSKVKDTKKQPRYVLGKIKSEFFGKVQIGDQIGLAVLSGKMMDTGGYADVEIFVDKRKKAKLGIFYGVVGSSGSSPGARGLV